MVAIVDSGQDGQIKNLMAIVFTMSNRSTLSATDKLTTDNSKLLRPLVRVIFGQFDGVGAFRDHHRHPPFHCLAVSRDGSRAHPPVALAQTRHCATTLVDADLDR